jgi:hypothetical protein
MNRLKTIWDFVFAVVLVGGLPQIIFAGLTCAVDRAGIAPPSNSDKPRDVILVLVLFGMISAASVFSLIWAMSWRRRHRLLRPEMIGAETGVGCMLGAAYFIVSLFSHIFPGFE